MSNDETLTRSELKSPDKFQEVASRVIDWMTANKKATRAGAIALAAVVLAVLVGAGVARSRETKAGALGYEVARVVGAQVTAGGLPVQDGLAFPTDADRQRAVIAEADRALATYPSSAAGRLALLMKSDAQFRLGELDAALGGYEQFLSATTKDQSLRFGALQGRALVLEAKGKLDDAVAAWDRAGAEAPAFADRAELEKARVLRAAGKRDEARKLLEGFEGRHKGSPLAPEAAERLASASGN